MIGSSWEALVLAGLGLGVAACDDTVVIAPVIDSPTYEWAVPPRLDAVELALSVEGAQSPLVAAEFLHDVPIELHDVPFGENLVLAMSGRAGDVDPVALGRTCTFAIRSDGPPAEPHLYFAVPAFAGEAPTAPSSTRSGGSGLTLPGGGALFAGGGGCTATGACTTLDTFEPRTGAFTTVAGLMPRDGARAARLGDGRIVIVGGRVGGAPASFIEAYDPGSGGVDDASFTVALEAALTEHGNGKVLLFGGSPDGGATLTDRVVMIKSEGALVVTESTGKLAIPRRGHTATALSDQSRAPVLIAGGTDGSGAPIAAAELFLPSDEGRFDTAFVAALDHPRTGHAAVAMADGSVLIIGGKDASGMPVTIVERFQQGPGFSELLDGQGNPVRLPDGAGVTAMAVTPLGDGRVLVTGGLDAAGTPVSTAYLFRFSLANTIELRPIGATAFQVPRAGHGAALMCDGTVLLVGGTSEPRFAERYTPPTVGS